MHPGFIALCLCLGLSYLHKSAVWISARSKNLQLQKNLLQYLRLSVKDQHGLAYRR